MREYSKGGVMAKDELLIPQNEHEFRIKVFTLLTQVQTDVAHIKNNGCLRGPEHDTIALRVENLEKESNWQKVTAFVTGLIGGGLGGGISGKL